MRLPPTPDFPAVIRRIEARGVSRSAIARTLHVNPSSVHRWLVGSSRPRYAHGAALVFLAGDRAPDAEPDSRP